MQRKANAVWSGNLKQGKGQLSTESGVLQDTPYGFAKRFESEPGTNPEELIAAAHAGCFTMALSAQLEEAGLVASSLRTSAAVTLEKEGNGFSITAIHLVLEAEIPGASQEAFEKAANAAKTGCPVSKVLNAAITMEARLVGG